MVEIGFEDQNGPISSTASVLHQAVPTANDGHLLAGSHERARLKDPMELAAIVGMCGLSLALGVGGTRAIFGAMFLMMPARASEDSLSAPSA